MSKHDNNIVTYAAPHTIKKFELIEAYVDRWSRKILEFDKSKGVIYIDCMSNSGMYFDDNGNPIEGTAIRVAKKLNEIILKYPTKKAVLIFNDISKSRIDFLKKEIEKRDFTNIEVLFYNEDSSQFLNGLALDSWNDFNTLLIYDPYKAEIDWQAISRFLNVWGEVIINHMVSDTIRGASQAKKEDVKRYVSYDHLSIDVNDYLKGMTLKSTNQKGYVLVCVNDISLGWGKDDNRILKNLYPKGLRIN